MHICIGKNHCGTLDAPGFLRSVCSKQGNGRTIWLLLCIIFEMVRINDECQLVNNTGSDLFGQRKMYKINSCQHYTTQPCIVIFGFVCFLEF